MGAKRSSSCLIRPGQFRFGGEMGARCPDVASGEERVCDTLRGPVHQAGGVVKNRLTHESSDTLKSSTPSSNAQASFQTFRSSIRSGRDTRQQAASELPPCHQRLARKRGRTCVAPLRASSHFRPCGLPALLAYWLTGLLPLLAHKSYLSYSPYRGT